MREIDIKVFREEVRGEILHLFLAGMLYGASIPLTLVSIAQWKIQLVVIFLCALYLAYLYYALKKDLNVLAQVEVANFILEENEIIEK